MVWGCLRVDSRLSSGILIVWLNCWFLYCAIDYLDVRLVAIVVFVVVGFVFWSYYCWFAVIVRIGCFRLYILVNCLLCVFMILRFVIVIDICMLVFVEFWFV